MTRAIALLSGGLDSVLSVKLILDQGIKVTALRFMTYFGCDAGGGGSCGHDASGLAAQLGFELKLCHLGQEYVEMVKNPKYGRGKNMNPCIDCRVMMLAAAKEYMEVDHADFIFTGEVLGQRPMSQHRQGFSIIDRQSGLEGYLLRPLSAKLLEPTIPERQGLVDRERLMDISGRSRKRQYELAAKWGITDFGQPAGGCLLTDPGYSQRLKDLFDHLPHPRAGDLQLLKAGRHFRPSPDGKIIVGRNQDENEYIAAFAEPGDVLVQLVDHNGPTTIVRGDVRESVLQLAAELTCRYGDAPKDAPAEVLLTFKSGGEDRKEVRQSQAAEDDRLDALRVAFSQTKTAGIS